MTAADFLPDSRSLTALRRAATGCQGCELFHDATQTVFGAGPATARLAMVGEQPGDVEDREGEPFVGPAGRLLDQVIEEAGIDRSEVYLTNAVKHFRFRRADRGKRRIHEKPHRSDIIACKPWLLAELTAVHPKLVVCLGATAAQAMLGWSFRLTEHRGELLPPPAELAEQVPGDWRLLATTHPSAVLRAGSGREDAYRQLLADLRAAADALAPS